MDAFPPSAGRFTAVDDRWIHSCVGERPPLASAPSAAVGELVGGYRLESEIHRGATSTVFAAVDLDAGRRVALKVLNTEFASAPERVRRFLREAEIARRVRHPAIVPVLDVGDDRAPPYYVLKLESGESLADHPPSASGRRAEGFYVDLAQSMTPVADAVALLHREGIVHRDIQPANLLIDREGLFLLTDFGAALERGADAVPPVDEWIGGELYYTSPGQLSPAADPFDPGADVYSLGLTLWGLVSGKRAFPDGSPESLARWKLTRRPETARHANAFVPPGLDAIIRQAMEPNPRLRYEHAGAFARDLRRFVSRKVGSLRRRGTSSN